MKGGSSSPSASQPQSGQPQQGSQEPQAQERTPEAPGQRPEQQGQKPESQGQEPQPQDGEPKGDKASQDDPRNSAGGPPPKLATDVSNNPKANEQWGDLPPTVRDLFRTEGGGDLPPQYRDWIDAYYRRLNQEKR